jgi:hypothetical protein
VTGSDETVIAARRVMAALVAGIQEPARLDASLASEALTIAPASTVLQRASLALASASDVKERVEAAREMHHVLTGIVRLRLAASPALEISDDPVRGRFADEVRRVRP